VYNFVIKGGVAMPSIKSSADLRNNYNEISTFCHTYAEPVFITKNGKGDLAVMSIEAYEEMTSRFELYGLIKEGLNDINENNTRPFSEAMSSIREKRKR
jgi:PHD/YefM family antitoxin component YafN of YafNO toxin-antitoxin module